MELVPAGCSSAAACQAPSCEQGGPGGRTRHTAHHVSGTGHPLRCLMAAYKMLLRLKALAFKALSWDSCEGRGGGQVGIRHC